MAAEAPSPLARHFAALLARLAPSDPALVSELATRLIAAEEGGDVCLDLREIGGDIEELRAILRGSAVVGAPGEWQPLILDHGDRLYLYRHWRAEEALAEALLQRSAVTMELDEARLREGLSRYFPDGGDDEQGRAAEAAVRRALCVISGGPGTGKTTTVVKILALLLEEHGSDQPPLRIALSAPTGKAAARLREAVERARDTLPGDAPLRNSLPSGARTLHRLLGSGRSPGTFRHGRHLPLPYDVVVVDEASMVDLSLMNRLVEALLPTARLILLGDRDQLASVEAGSVLADLCAVPPATDGEPPPLGRAVVTLTKSRRFSGGDGIGALCRAVRQGEGAEALALLRAGGEGISWRELPDPVDFETALAEMAEPYGALATVRDPLAALQLLKEYAILCALRHGPYGAVAVNRAIERNLIRRGLIDPRSPWYPGRPVMITRNDASRELFNGDLGLILPDRESGEPRVFLPDGGGGVRSLHPMQLPEHETAFAMTVHKSQGSEFGRVALILSPQGSEIVSRELIYTGISRARRSVQVWGGEEAFVAEVERQVRRSSGLRERLWG